jgi:hypothetical protein
MNPIWPRPQSGRATARHQGHPDTDQTVPMGRSSADPFLNPWRLRMNGPDCPLHLNNPGLRLGFIAEIWDQLAPSTRLHQFDTKTLVDLPYHAEGHL